MQGAENDPNGAANKASLEHEVLLFGEDIVEDREGLQVLAVEAHDAQQPKDAHELRRR